MLVYVHRVADPERMVAELRDAGLHLAREQHGAGPVHYAIERGDVVLEVYPADRERPCDRCAGRVEDDRPATICAACLGEIVLELRG